LSKSLQIRDAIIADLKATRIPYEPLWREVDQYVAPGMLRLQLSDANRGTRDDSLIINSSADKAFETFQNGMISNVTNPSQPWIEIATDDQDLSDYGPVAVFCEDVAREMLTITEDAGVYEDLKGVYGYGGKFANGCMWMEENYERVIHTQPMAVGQWWIGNDEFGDPNVFYRELRMTVRQVVEKFLDRRKPDWDKVSVQVKELWDKGMYGKPVDVAHLITPNDEYDERYVEASGKRFWSCYFEIGGERSDRDRAKYLRESGYDEFPALHFKWDVFGDDIYGMNAPGITTLPDNKELQHWALKGATALDNIVDPAMMGPPGFKKKGGFFPGSFHAMQDSDLQRGGVRPVRETPPQVLEAKNHELAIEKRLQDGWHMGVFRYLDPTNASARTATEIAARQQQNMLELVGTMNRLNRGVLNPYTERLFNYMIRQGRIGPNGIPIPPELEGQKLKIRYVSQMAQAMRSINVTSIDRLLETAIRIANEGKNPQVWNKLNVYECMDASARSLGVPARVMRSDEEVAAMEAEQKQAAAAEQKAMQMQTITKGVKDLANSPTDGKNALTDVANALGG
jgi:hypothetical protein